MIIASFFTNLIGILVFLFIFWKRLKEDYSSEIIFETAFFILFGSLLFWFLSIRFFPTWFLWSTFVGSLLGLGVANLKLKIRFYETLEALVVSTLPWLAFIFLKNSVVSSSLSSFLAFLVTLIMVSVAYWLDLSYKGFTWYKSGKVGFVGIATLAIIFLVRSAIALTGITVLSFVGRYEAMVSGAAAFICFLLIFNLGRK